MGLKPFGTSSARFYVIVVADEREDFRDPQGTYGRSIDPDEKGWQVSKRELAEARLGRS